jgi:hypothetical protein
LGGGAAAQWFVIREVSLRLAAGAREGSVDGASATSTLTLLGAVGGAWNVLRSNSPGPLLAFRVDFLVERSSVTHLAQTHGFWPPEAGVDGVVEMGWSLTADVDAVCGFGFEQVFKATHVDVQGVRIPVLIPSRGVAEAGIRLRF